MLEPLESTTPSAGDGTARGNTVGDEPRQEQLDFAVPNARFEEAAPAVTAVAPPVQGGLFPDDSVPDELVGYRGPSACQIAGITYRQLDYWARTSLVVPSIRGAAGSGSQRLYSFKDILVLKIVKRLLDTGISLHNIRVAVDHLRQRGVADLANITLFSDGTTVYECTSAEEVVDLLQGGQGVFGIAVSGAMRELTGAIAEFPGERADGGESIAAPEDELASRRKNRDRKIGSYQGRIDYSRESPVAAGHGRRRSNTSPPTSQAPGPRVDPMPLESGGVDGVTRPWGKAGVAPLRTRLNLSGTDDRGRGRTRPCSQGARTHPESGDFCV
jgi:DNA-binding transcriptional MerR regulator